MNIQLIRNATMKITVAGKTILTDPMLSDKGAMKAFAGIARNPTIPLPEAVTEILDGVDAFLISHLHPDHLDPAAIEALPKNLPLFCQPGDEESLKSQGFNDVRPVAETKIWEGIALKRTGGKHGQGKVLERMGKVSGFVLKAKNEKTLYWAGDTIWCDEVKETLTRDTPDIILTHSGGATPPGHDPIIMDIKDTLKVLETASHATVVAVHMESLDHCPVSRAQLRAMADEAGIDPARLQIPADGEEVTL